MKQIRENISKGSKFVVTAARCSGGQTATASELPAIEEELPAATFRGEF